ncbi:MAG: fatty acid desaturase [Dongiaceae bacterium]
MTDINEFSAVLTDVDPERARRRPAIDWPTFIVGTNVYAAFLIVTWNFHALPWWLVMPLGGFIVCLHGSLQHEAVHGQPFRRRILNSAFVFPSLWLWLPYTQYRRTHLIHHRNERLTSPVDDPESNYVTAEQWTRMGAAHRLLRRAMTTSAGRLLLTPPYVAATVWFELFRKIRRRDLDYLRHWLIQIPAAGLVLAWVMGVCGIPFWQYLLLFAYPGVSLTVLRSYLEHQARVPVDERTAIVEAGPVMSLLYLNNNLHALHHLEPATPWHQRRRRFNQRRDEIYAGNGHYSFSGYGEIVWRYLFRPKEPVVHPIPGI